MSARVPFQPSLFPEPPRFDARFSALTRHFLDERAWVDHAPGWLSGSGALFERLVAERAWAQRKRWMYDAEVLEPRLTSFWLKTAGAPLEPDLLEQMRACLSARYQVPFDSVGFNLYRDGRDSVAWHRDRIHKTIAEPVVALVSLGFARRLLLRPYGGGRSRAFTLGQGDLFVTGGATQRQWEHSLPKVARAGARMSLAFRHGMELTGYER